MTLEKPHLSPSQLDMFSMCGEAYRRRYIMGHIIPPGIALVKGTAVHFGSETNFKQKVKSRVDLPAKQIIEASVANLEGRIKAEGLILTDEEQTIGKKNVVGTCKDSTVLLADLFAREVAPLYQPKHVENKVRLVLPNSERDIVGIMDLDTEKDEVVDLKTGKAKKNQDYWDKSLQMTTYAALKKARDKKPPKKIIIEQLIHTGKSDPKRHVIETTRSRPDFDVLAARMNAMNKAIKVGVFMPAPVGSWKCSPTYCGYWKTCVYVNSERKAAAAKVAA